MAEARADAQLDREMEDDDDYDGESIEESYLTFLVQEAEYAVCLTNVIEIVVGQRIIEVPDVPNFVKGVINLRGKVIPVMDVRTRFGLPFRPYGARLSIVVVEVDGVSTGLAVDEVKEVLQIPAADVSPPPHYRKQGGGRVIRGMGKRKDAVSIILDVPRLMEAVSVDVDAVRAAVDSMRPSAGMP